MNIIDKLKGIGKGYAWSFSGFLLGILSLTVAAYLFYLERGGQKVDLEILIDSEENLVEVREQIKDLSIMYKGKDIINSQEEIKILALTLHNKGKEILQQYYDQNQPFGISFLQSSIISFRILDSNSDYLMENLRPSIGFEDGNEINTIELNNKQSFGLTGNLYFAKVILERNIFVKIKVYLIQPKGISKTELKFIGKIAGIKKISINYAQKASSKESETFPFAVAIFSILGIAMIFTTIWLLRRRLEEMRSMRMLDLMIDQSNILLKLKEEKKIRRNE